MNTNWRVYNLVKTIPKGRVLTYGAIAKSLGIKSPRLVGKILHNNPAPQEIPCHRVVFADGSLATNFAFGGNQGQSRLLAEEGVTVLDNKKVDIDKYFWRNV